MEDVSGGMAACSFHWFGSKFVFLAELKCLQVIMNDSSNKLEDDCRTMLTQRAEMFSNSAALASVSDLYEQMVMSPAKRSFVVLILSVCGMVFIFGMVCGRVNRSQAMKNK